MFTIVITAVITNYEDVIDKIAQDMFTIIITSVLTAIITSLLLWVIFRKTIKRVNDWGESIDEQGLGKTLWDKF